jgi:hypothetical protein
MRTLIATIALLATPSPPVTYWVHSPAEFRDAVTAARPTGGNIVLFPGRYSEPLVLSGRLRSFVRIIGKPGAVVQRLVLDHTRNVSVGPLRVAPLNGDAVVRVTASRNIALHDLHVSARGTLFSAGVEIPGSTWVSIQESQFSHCGDRSPNWVNCLTLRDRARHVAVAHSWFHDCRGCDFVHGRMDAFLTIRDSRFERALPCRLDRINQEQLRALLGRYASVRCDHQDLIELFGGSNLRFEHNRFGVYERGGAQLYITGEGQHATIANNTFVGTDPRIPGYRSRVGLLVGGSGGGPIPYFVRILHNKIYTGARRLDGYEGSISISRGYGWRVPVGARPLIAHNVIGLLQTPVRLCTGAKMVANVILRGRGCSN